MMQHSLIFPDDAKNKHMSTVSFHINKSSHGIITAPPMKTMATIMNIA